MNTLTKKQRKQLKKMNKFIEYTPLPHLTYEVIMKLGEGHDGYIHLSKEHQLLDGWYELVTYAHDVCTYGASGGTYGSFIWYEDTVSFVENNRNAIKDLLEVYSEGDNPYKDMPNWNGMRDYDVTGYDIQGAFWYADKEIEYYDQILSQIAWFVVEEVSRWYVDYKDGN